MDRVHESKVSVILAYQHRPFYDVFLFRAVGVLSGSSNGVYGHEKDEVCLYGEAIIV